MKTNPEGQSDIIIHIANVSRRFGSKLALKNVDLQVERGKVFGLVGENGAGKTTLIKHMLGLLRAETGSVRVFGMDPVQNPPEVLSQRDHRLAARQRGAVEQMQQRLGPALFRA